MKKRRRGSLTNCKKCVRAAGFQRWKGRNRERKRALNLRWSSANREKDRAKKAKWQHEHPAVGCAKTARRHAAQAQRTPAWADHDAINAFYVIAARVTRCTGIRFEVDHIVPLRGQTVSGLHVHNNLRVIPRYQNMLKGNSLAEAA